MKNLFIITGASRGIGKAVALSISKYFKNEENVFFLISKDAERLDGLKKEIKGEAITLSCDLSLLPDSIEKIEQEMKNLSQDFDRCILINNAGIIEPIGFLGTVDNESIVRNLNVNLVSALALTNAFLKVFSSFEGKKMVINISSGAGRMPIVCWAPYCSSKAGMDMFAKVLAQENSDIKVFSVAPGIVETDMQKVIRSTGKKDFPLLDEFINFQKAGVLKTPEDSAEEIVSLIKNPDRYETIVSF